MLLDAINRSSFVIYNNFLTLLKDFANDKIDASTYQTQFFKLLHKDDGFLIIIMTLCKVYFMMWKNIAQLKN